jgi:penicillin-binding protein A
LPDGRVGVQLHGWTRPIRDDELDHEPHGNVSLTRGLVVSCNAYFAQLGVQLGPQALLDTAALFQIAPATPATPAELRKGLPFASYGQGEVRATPLRMATVAGAMATGGLLYQPYWVVDAKSKETSEGKSKDKDDANASSNPNAGASGSRSGSGSATASASNSASAAPVRVIDTAHAAEIASAMRGVVTNGTGRVLANAVVPIAGKTGTAQIDGAASHSWFIGFAPYGGAAASAASANAGAGAASASAADGAGKDSDRASVSGTIAFAVLLENAGYGARAAPVVAEVVRAARDLGLVRDRGREREREPRKERTN